MGGVAVPQGFSEIPKNLVCCAKNTKDFNILLTNFFQKIKTNEKFRKEHIKPLKMPKGEVAYLAEIERTSRSNFQSSRDYFSVFYFLDGGEARIFNISKPKECPKLKDGTFPCTRK